MSSYTLPPTPQARIEELSQRVDKLYEQLVEAQVKQANNLDEVLKEFGARLRSDLLSACAHSEQELEERIENTVSSLAKRVDRQLNGVSAWRAKVDTKLATWSMPLGETLREIIAQRLVLMARRIWVDTRSEVHR